ncbi:unnamed protein product [Periconia digitata]|uniref:Uncharacterized protein n=1 Tax=Periconia digitata TaxID=1303443 RepID=A0A9W4XH63_9PLEO|nr:unnamed protein product [Periconia digitata]
MYSLQQLFFCLFAVFTIGVFAQSSFDSTVYVTSTVYRVNTVTATGTPPVGGPVNSTLTIAPTPYATVQPSAVQPSASISYSAPSNGTNPKPTGGAAPPTTEFPGAASGFSVNGPVVALVAVGLGFLAL